MCAFEGVECSKRNCICPCCDVQKAIHLCHTACVAILSGTSICHCCDVQEAFHLLDRVVLMDSGRTVYMGPPKYVTWYFEHPMRHVLLLCACGTANTSYRHCCQAHCQHVASQVRCGLRCKRTCVTKCNNPALTARELVRHVTVGKDNVAYTVCDLSWAHLMIAFCKPDA